MIWERTAAFLLWLSTGACAAMLAGSIGNFLTAPRLERPVRKRKSIGETDGSGSRPASRVSLLIPARDEEANLAILMPLLSRIDHPDLEILVLDDQSSDRTAGIAGAAGSPARVIRGRPLPPDWLGKNWACFQLAEKAKGDILIFCDADVRVGPGAIAATVARMEAEGLDALTCLPRQILGSWAEKAVIPVLLFLPLLGFLPMALIPRTPHPRLSVGCGQWFAFRRDAYERLGGHEAVRREIVEDMALGRLVKARGMVLGAAVSTRHLAARMYSDLPSVWRGFGKNLAFLTGSGWVRPPLVLAAFLIVHVLPWSLSLLGFRAWLLPFGLWTASRLLTAIAFREPASAWLWSPAGTLLIPALAVRSWLGYRRRDVRWKGRILAAAFEGAGEAEPFLARNRARTPGSSLACIPAPADPGPSHPS